MISPSGMRGAMLGMPRLRRWSLAELLLAGVLLALAGAAWLLTSRLSTPDMRVGILTGAQPMDQEMRPWPLAAALFLVTWVVMMAAMMLPSIVPFTVRMARLMRVHAASGGRTIALIVGYFLVWTGMGAASYLILRGFEAIVVGPGVIAARVGAVVLLAAGLYQFTPLKRVCLRHCRSPTLLLLHHGEKAVGSRFGALRVGIGHGVYCIGCCWALMVVLLAAGVMSLVWMGVIAALVAVEKVNRHGEIISLVLGALLIVQALVLFVEPNVLAVVS
jgi:predicted metal-binding membrane protein